MIPIPSDKINTFNIVGLDPGSNTFGFALFTVSLNDLSIIASNALTIVGDKLMGKETLLEELYGTRFARINSIEEKLVQLFCFYAPLIIATESPFINNAFPAAGIALTEVMSAIKRAVIRYDQWRTLHLIPPSSVKNAVGCIGNGNKDAIKEKLLTLPNLNYSGFIPIQRLDEHSIDALAVAYSIWKTL